MEVLVSLTALIDDVRIAARRLAARPGYSALITLTLAIGIGSATAVFSVVDQTVLRPAPFAYADRLVDVMHIHSVTKGGGNALTPAKILGWQQQAALFERFEAYSPQQMDVTGAAEPERLSGLNVSLGLFSMLGVQPKLGRSFATGDGAPGSERVVIISDAIWHRRFGGQADVLGQQMMLNDVGYTVVGVMPRRFRLLQEEEAFWLPVDLAARVTDPTARGFYGLGRLAPGVCSAFRLPGHGRSDRRTASEGNADSHHVGSRPSEEEHRACRRNNQDGVIRAARRGGIRTADHVR